MSAFVVRVDTAQRTHSGVGVVLETTDGLLRQRTSQTSPHSQQKTLL